MRCHSQNFAVFKEKVYGLVVAAVPSGTPSTWSWTPATPVPVSDALTVTVIVPVSEAPAAGVVMLTVGGVVSGRAAAARKATICITHPSDHSGAHWRCTKPGVVTTRSSAISPSGLVSIRCVKFGPGPVVVRPLTVLAPTNRSMALVVVTVPVAARSAVTSDAGGHIDRIERINPAVLQNPNVRELRRRCESHSHCVAGRRRRDVFRVIDGLR